MKRTMLTTILAMSFALGASRADMPAGTNKPEKHHGGGVDSGCRRKRDRREGSGRAAETGWVELDRPGGLGKNAAVDGDRTLWALYQQLPLFHVAALPDGPVGALLDLRLSSKSHRGV
jgi:hypothetical protein